MNQLRIAWRRSLELLWASVSIMWVSYSYQWDTLWLQRYSSVLFIGYKFDGCIWKHSNQSDGMSLKQAHQPRIFVNSTTCSECACEGTWNNATHEPWLIRVTWQHSILPVYFSNSGFLDWKRIFILSNGAMVVFACGEGGGEQYLKCE